MDWKKYETEIYQAFQETYPEAKILFNQKIVGRYSKVERQVDVLIEGRIAGKTIKLIIDGKYYSKKIDVKEVESFIGMTEDVGAVQGILMTSRGYTQAAINRAHYGPSDIELDILNFAQLRRFQGGGGFIHKEWYGAMIPAPLGWIVDGTQRGNALANLYQRGKSFEKAVKEGEFIYVNIFPFDEAIQNLDEVLRFHEDDTRKFHPTATFSYSETIERRDGFKTLLRKIIRDSTHLEEHTGFVAFEISVFFASSLHHKN